LIARAGNDFSRRFSFVATAVKSLPVFSCLIVGEAIVCDVSGLAVFELIRPTGQSPTRFIAPSISSSGKDLRRESTNKRVLNEGE
jgi:ATP-dependent DNA ligase